MTPRSPRSASSSRPRSTSTPRDDPQGAATYRPVFAEHPPAVAMGGLELGSDYWGTVAYILVVNFSPEKPVPGQTEEWVLFWKHLGIDKWRGNALPSCRSPIEQLRENVHEGKRLKFCCGKVEDLPTCCCGGWTHEVVSCLKFAFSMRSCALTLPPTVWTPT